MIELSPTSAYNPAQPKSLGDSSVDFLINELPTNEGEAVASSVNDGGYSASAVVARSLGSEAVNSETVIYHQGATPRDEHTSDHVPSPTHLDDGDVTSVSDIVLNAPIEDIVWPINNGSVIKTKNDSYTILDSLDKGGMGQVFLASNSAGNTVALKVATVDPTDKTTIKRLKREIENMIRANGKPGVISIIDHQFDIDNSRNSLIVMPLYSAGNFANRLRNDNSLYLIRAINILKKTAYALAELHKLSIVHRDLKPQNILLEEMPNPTHFDRFDVRICDFGLSKDVSDTENPAVVKTQVTATGVILGTADYMAPEQAKSDKNLDQSADIFSWAAVAYQVCTGRNNLDGNMIQKIASLQSMDQNTVSKNYIPVNDLNPEIPQELADLIDVILSTADKKERLVKAGLSTQGSKAAKELGDKLADMVDRFTAHKLSQEFKHTCFRVSPTYVKPQKAA